jgi:hypothetical protein
VILITHVRVTTTEFGLRLRTGVEAILAVELNLSWVRKRALYCSMVRDDDELRHNQDFSLRKGTTVSENRYWSVLIDDLSS